MPYACVLTTVSKANTSGGTFADTLSANSGDSAAVANFNTGGARILELWGIINDTVGEVQFVYTRPESTHDQSHGLRFNIPVTLLGGDPTLGCFELLPGFATVPLMKSDTPTISVTSTAADDAVFSWVTEYDDLPGVSAVFSSPGQVQAMRKSTVGISVLAVASATPGAYGASRAFNTDDNRLHANTWYAILGASVQIVACTISLLGPDWGGQRIGFPSGSLNVRSTTWFIDQSIKWGKPLIPCFNSNNASNILVQVADGEASTSPKIDFLLYELTGYPGG